MSRVERSGLLCVVEGRADRWEAICLDLDIAVAGDTLDHAMRDLELAVGQYVATAHEEAPAIRENLLARRAPLWLRVRTLTRVAFSLLRNRFGSSGAGGGSFVLPCPA